MQKDINIPEVKEIYVAVVLEENEEFRKQDWNAYLINGRSTAIETVLIVTSGYDEKDATATMRHSLKVLPAKSFAKIEFLQDEVLRLTNEYSISFFAEGKMYHKKFLFPKNSISAKAQQELPVMQQDGVLAK